MSAEDMKLSMQRTRIHNKGFGLIPTHYIIDCSGKLLKVNDWKDIVGATLNAEANQKGIHIELVGDFNISNPTDAQYTTLKNLIKDTNKRAGKALELKRHGDFQAKNCPGKNFDFTKLEEKKEPKKEPKKIQFSISRYYSPMPDQTRYLSDTPGYISTKYSSEYIRMGYKQGYERDVCMNCGCSLQGEKKLYDCTIPSDGQKLTEEDIYKVVACPKEYKLGTKFNIAGLGTLICRDRGGAIKGNRLDLWMGIGEKALDNRQKKKGGVYYGYVLYI